MALRWDLDNCHTQCVHCNGIHEEDESLYRAWMVKTYGSNYVDHLESYKWAQPKVTRIDKIDIYHDLCAEAKRYGVT